MVIYYMVMCILFFNLIIYTYKIHVVCFTIDNFHLIYSLKKSSKNKKNIQLTVNKNYYKTSFVVQIMLIFLFDDLSVVRSLDQMISKQFCLTIIHLHCIT